MIRSLQKIRVTIAFCAALLSFPALAQNPTFEEVRTLTRGPQPVVRTVDFPAAGTYRLTLSDLAVPVPFASLQVAITRGDVVVASRATPGNLDVNITTAGEHVLRVVGLPGASVQAGSFGVRVVNPSAGDAVVLEMADAIDSPPADSPPNRRILDTEFQVTAAGTYEVTLADHDFPQALGTLTLAILRDGGATIDAQLAAAGNTSFVATPGRYRLLVIGEAPDVSGAGAFGVRVRDAALQVVYARSEAVGKTQEMTLADPLLAGAHELQLSDLAFPAPLSASGALLTRGGVVAAQLASPGVAPFNATGGVYQLFVLATASPSVPGSVGIELRRGASTVFSSVQAAPATDANSTVRTFNYVLDIATAGNYRLRFTDFDFPVPLLSKGFAASQNGVLLGSLSTGGSLDLNNVAAGRLFVVAFGQPAVGTPSGLLGIDLAAAAAGSTPLFERTEAIGTLFFSRSVPVPTAGEYQVAVTDLRFPAQFAELAAVVTRGANRLGSVFAGGDFNFPATAGNYTVTVVAQPALNAMFGTYGLRLTPRAAAPVLNFAADATSVNNGGTAMLTWSSTHATSCAASGGWSGARTVSGSERTAAITVSTTFTLNCDGPGGQRTASVTVTPQAASNPGGSGGGGGGRLDLLLLAGLAMVLFVIRGTGRRRGSKRTFHAAPLGVLLAALLVGGDPAWAGDVVATAVTGSATSTTDERGYRVQPGDVLVVAVWKERDLQGDILVRPDGGITFPLAGDIQAGGRTVVELAGDIAEKLKRYIPDPVVTVAVKSIGGNRVYVLGKVNRPGEFAFSQPLDVMQALALAGGATPFAAVNDIRILRRNGNRLIAVEFQYADVERGRNLEQNIVLRSGDTVVVP